MGGLTFLKGFLISTLIPAIALAGSGSNLRREACTHTLPFDLGLYPIPQDLETQIDTLIRISRRGFRYDWTSIETGTWKVRPENTPFLLQLATETEPRLKVENYLSEWEIYPPLREKLSGDELAEVMTATSSAERVAALRETKTYAKARAWEQRAMEATVWVHDRFRKFSDTAMIRLKLFSADVSNLPEKQRLVVLNEVERQLHSDQPYRVRLIGNEIEASLIFPLGTANLLADSEESSNEEGQPAEDGKTPTLDFVAWALLRMGQEKDAISRMLSYLLLQKSTTVGTLAEVEAKGQLAIQAEEDALKAYSGLKNSQKISTLVKRLWPGAVGAGAQKTQNIAMSRWFFGGHPEVAQKVSWITDRLEWAGFILIAAAHGADVLSAIFSPTSKKSLPTALVKAGGAAGLAMAFKSLGRVPSAWLLLGIVGSEIGHLTKPDVPTLDDATTFLSEDLWDMYSSYRRLLGGKNPAEADMRRLREEGFPTLRVDSFMSQLRELQSGPSSAADLNMTAAVYAQEYLNYALVSLQVLGQIDRNRFEATTDGDLGCRSLLRERSERDVLAAGVSEEIGGFLNAVAKVREETETMPLTLEERRTELEYALDTAIQESDDSEALKELKRLRRVLTPDRLTFHPFHVSP